MMKINGMEIDFDISNVQHAENMEKALNNMAVSEKKVLDDSRNKSLSVTLRGMIMVFQEFFVTATGIDVLAGCQNLQVAKDAYEEFLVNIKEQKEQLLQPFSVERIR